jgi:hypothetical protein
LLPGVFRTGGRHLVRSVARVPPSALPLSVLCPPVAPCPAVSEYQELLSALSNPGTVPHDSTKSEELAEVALLCLLAWPGSWLLALHVLLPTLV